MYAALGFWFIKYLFHSFNTHVLHLLHLFSNRNVLQDESGRLKVTDFGLSKIAQEKEFYGYKMSGRTGSCKISHISTTWIFGFSKKKKFSYLCLHLTDRYMAPEVYRRESYGKSVDVFSFALIVLEVFQISKNNFQSHLLLHFGDLKAPFHLTPQFQCVEHLY